MKLNGIKAPDGDGTVLEVHLDIQRATPEFAAWLGELGFEDDPFATFFPLGYVAHMTGRLRVLPRDLHATLPGVNALVASVIHRALECDLALYAETELVTNIWRFDGDQDAPLDRVLDGLAFARSGRFGGAKSDVHIEFPHGQVPEAVRAYLSGKEFYWVSTPDTPACLAEDIATLQTSTFGAGKRVAELLVEHPLPGCTAIHLEQKLAMVATNFNLAMPEVIEVTR